MRFKFHKMNEDFDALIEITLFPSEESGHGPIFSGYRGAHLIEKDYLTSGIIQFVDKEMLYPGEKALAFVNYLSPEAYPHSLWIGKEMNIQEGSRVVGTSKVIEIYNQLLLMDKT